MLSTKMLPAVGVLYPIYLLFIQLGLLDSRVGLVLVMMLINLPIIVWMLYTYFREIPGEILEADIKFFHNVMKLVRDWYFVQVAPLDPRAATLPMRGTSRSTRSHASSSRGLRQSRRNATRSFTCACSFPYVSDGYGSCSCGCNDGDPALLMPVVCLKH